MPLSDISAHCSPTASFRRAAVRRQNWPTFPAIPARSHAAQNCRSSSSVITRAPVPFWWRFIFRITGEVNSSSRAAYHSKNIDSCSRTSSAADEPTLVSTSSISAAMSLRFTSATAFDPSLGRSSRRQSDSYNLAEDRRSLPLRLAINAGARASNVSRRRAWCARAARASATRSVPLQLALICSAARSRARLSANVGYSPSTTRRRLASRPRPTRN